MRRRHRKNRISLGRFGPYYSNVAAEEAVAAGGAEAKKVGEKMDQVGEVLKERRQQFEKFADRQMKSTMEFMKQAIGGMLGFAGVNAVESVIEKTPIGTWGKLATKGIATGGVYFTARFLSKDDTVRRAVLIGALINVGLSVVSDALAGKGLGAGVAGMAAYNPYNYQETPQSFEGYDYAQGYALQQ